MWGPGHPWAPFRRRDGTSSPHLPKQEGHTLRVTWGHGCPWGPTSCLSLGWRSGWYPKGRGGGVNCFLPTLHHKSRLSVHFSLHSSKVQWETSPPGQECSLFCFPACEHQALSQGAERECSAPSSWRCLWSRKRWNPGPLCPALCLACQP